MDDQHGGGKLGLGRFAIAIALFTWFTHAAILAPVVLQAKTTGSVKLSAYTVPSSAEAGVTTVNVTGSGFPSGTIGPANVTVTVTPSGIGPPITAVVQTVTTLSGSSRKITFILTASSAVTAPTPYLVSVSGTTTQGTAFSSSNKASLTINPPSSIASISPVSGQPGQSLSVIIIGNYSNFVQGKTLAGFGPSISVGGAAEGALGPVTVSSPTKAKAQVKIDPSAPHGASTLTVQTGPEIATLSNGFSVVLLPILSQVSPNSGQQAQQNLYVSLTGQNTHFLQGTTAASFGSGITVTALTVNSQTSATAVLSIDQAASLGSRTVTLTTGSEVATLVKGFTVTAGTPLLLQIVPNTGQQGQQNLSVSIVARCSHFVQGQTNASFGAGITVASVTVKSGTAINAVLNISSNAALGPRNVTLTTGSEMVTQKNGFTVIPPVLGTALTSASPNNGQQGQQNLSVTLTGQSTHFVQGTTAASFGAGITVASLTVNSATSATAVINIASTAAVGAQTVTVTTAAEVVSLASGFTVAAGTPILAQLSPSFGQQGQQNLSVSITGQFTHFVQGTTTASFGAGITVASLSVNSATTAIAVINIASSATVGGQTVTVTTGTEVVSLSNGFTVTAGTPVLTQVSPSIGQQGQANLSVTLTGQYTHFAQGATTASFEAGITVTSLTVNSPTAITAIINISSTVSAGTLNVTVTTAAEVVSLASGFTVTAGAAAISSVNPTSGQQGQQNLSVTISGQFTNFVQGTTTASFGAGITTVSLNVTSATSAAATLNIDPGAATGARSVTVTTGAEVVALASGFTLTPGTPVLTQVSPNTGQPGQQSISVGVTGQFTHFVQGTTTANFGAGVTVASLTVSSATSFAAVLNVDPTATVGARNLTVTTGAEMISLPNAFTVTAGTPVLTQANPNSGHQGQQALSVTITGQFTQFVQGTTTASFGAGVTVTSLTVNSTTSATAVLNIDPAAATGPHTVILTTGSEIDSLNNGFTILAGQLTLSVQPPVSPTFQSSQVISGALANGIGQSEVTISGGAAGVSQSLASGQTQFGPRVPLRPNAENLLTVKATDSSSQTATADNLRIIQLTLSDIVTAQVSAQRLSAAEIQALVANGTINLSNPSNFNVSMFAVALTIGGHQASVSVPVIQPLGQLFALGPPVTISCQAPTSDIQQNGNDLLVPCGNGSGGNLDLHLEKIQLIPFVVDEPSTGATVPGVLLIDGKIKTLKEFFNVNLLLMNVSSGFTLTGISAMVNVPDNGLSPVAPASAAITMGDLVAGSQGTGQFVIRGDVIGVHAVTVNFGASLSGPLLTTPIPISGSASTDVEVKGPPTLNVTVEQPASVTAGVPYTLKVNIQNTSPDLDALYASLELDLPGSSLIDPTTGLSTNGANIASLGNILAGQSVSQSYTVLPNQTGPITSCVAGASENITLSVVFTSSGQSCAVGTLPSQTVSSTGQPTVVVLPAPNTVNVPVATTVNAFFSDAIQTQTITTGGPGATFLVMDSTGATVPGQLQFSALSNGATVATFLPTAPLAPNSNYAVVIAPSIFDANGLQLASGITSNFTTAPPAPTDTTPPQVTIQILPPANPVAVPQGQLLDVLVNSSDNSGVVARVDLLLDGQLVDSQVPQSAVTFLFDSSTLSPGSSHTLTAVATDPAGNTSQASLNIAITSDATPPTVSISAATSVFGAQILPVSIQASDNIRVARVDLFLDSGASPIYTGFIAPYQASLDTTSLTNGLHQLRAVATDGAGNVAQATLGFSVISVASIALSPGTITLSGTGSTQPLTVTATLTDASTTPILSGVAFSSSNTNVAVVDSSGVVTSVTPGTATITAIFGSLPPAQAMVTDIASVPTALALVSGNNQTSAVGLQLAAPLVVKVTDANNRPVPNVAVTFLVLAGGGTVGQNPGVTDAQGLSSTTLTLGQTPGANSATATAGTLAGSPVTFVASGVLPTPGLSPTATSELFNLTNLNWSPLGAMSIPRAGTTLTVLGDGTVLVIGGVNTAANMFSSVVSGELFTPATGAWAPTVSLTAPRAFHTTTLLPNGTVLITGGLDANGNPLATSEIYRGPPIVQTTPVLTWATPTSIAHATPLGSAQLNATANVPGIFVYNPPSGTTLAAGSQKLTVTFTPTDTIHYTTATASVTLTVTP